jgi:transportin-3
MLPYLAQGLSIPKCASSSANAIKILCEHCSLTLSLGDSVLDLYDGIVAAQQQSHPVLDLQDELLVLEGACKAISLQMSDTTKAKDPERISMYIRRLVEPIGTRLANTTFVGPGSTSPRLALNELDRLTVVARFLHLPRPNDDLSSDANRRISSRSEFLTQLMSQCWPWLDTLSQKYPNDFNMAEKVCRLHKHVLRGCGSSGYGDMIQPLCANIVRGYTQSHLSPYLYLASICVSEYGNDSRYVSLLFDMVRDVSEKTFSVLRSPEDLVAQPDVVEELFFLAGRMMTHCPVPLLLSPLLGAMIQFSTVCMKLDHKDANRGTLSFLESTISFGIDLSRGEAHVSNDSQQLISCRESLENCIRSEGIHIVQNLMQALMGTLPCYRLDSPHGSVGSILYKLKQLCPSLTLEWVIMALHPAPDHAKRTLLRSFADTTNNISFDEMMSTVRWFSNYCIREMKMRGE